MVAPGETFYPWNETQLSDAEQQHWRIGELDLHLKATANEWLVAAKAVAAGDAEPESPEDKDWARYLLAGAQSTATLVPALPDRPVVVRPEATLTLCPGSQAVFHVSIPMWVRITADGETAICEHPSTTLSNTWFGEPTAGELCYALRTRARRNDVPDGLPAHRALCTLSVTNGSESALEFERLCIRTELLGAFAAQDQLWTNAVQVVFQGEDAGSKVTVDDGPGPAAEGAVKLSYPREPGKKGLLRKSFSSIRSQFGMGVF